MMQDWPNVTEVELVVVVLSQGNVSTLVYAYFGRLFVRLSG